METLISPSTKRNWERLGTDGASRLTKRANKTSSVKRFFPVEYATSQSGIAFVQYLTKWSSEHGLEHGQMLYVVAEALLGERGIIHKPHVQEVLREYAPKKEACIPVPLEGLFPSVERDLLGLLYQGVLLEGQKNRTGSYYTPPGIVSNMVADFDFSEGQTFLDPCCGSGSFLLALDGAEPGQLYGFDKDPIAVMIAKVNLLLKYPDHIFTPQIFCLDYLGKAASVVWESGLCPPNHDYIATNPPWGASSFVSRESFASFFEKSFAQLKKGGTIRFLFPEAVLRVKAHQSLRGFLLDRCCMERITLYDDMFSGVTTGFIDISCRREAPAPCLWLCDQSGEREISLSVLRGMPNCVFCFPTEEAYQILQKIRQMGRYDLSDSIWALGIVTGDNKGKLKNSCEDGCEAIYTGKEIGRYTLKSATKYLLYDRSRLQQVAREECYRAPEKLAYRFVSDRLVFAYDDSGSLFLNSANLLIPKIPHMGIKTVMAFLNSDVFRFFYTQIFGGVKVLKGNLEKLPFPEITEKQNLYLEQLTDRILGGEIGLDSMLQEAIFSLYGFSEKQKSLIREK